MHVRACAPSSALRGRSRLLYLNRSYELTPNPLPSPCTVFPFPTVTLSSWCCSSPSRISAATKVLAHPLRCGGVCVACAPGQASSDRLMTSRVSFFRPAPLRPGRCASSPSLRSTPSLETSTTPSNARPPRATSSTLYAPRSSAKLTCDSAKSRSGWRYLRPPSLLPSSSLRVDPSFLPPSFLLPPSSFLLPPSSLLLPPSSFLLPPCSFLLSPSSFLLPPSSFLLPPSLLPPPSSSLVHSPPCQVFD